jgi:hypothetical protein
MCRKWKIWASWQWFLAGDRGEPLMHPGTDKLLDRPARSPIRYGLYTNGSFVLESMAAENGPPQPTRLDMSSSSAEGQSSPSRAQDFLI